jgi:hypothetical protein
MVVAPHPFRREMSRRLVMFGLVAAASITSSCSTGGTPQPAAVRTVTVTHGTIAFVPDIPAAQQETVVGQITAVLRTLYTRGFVRVNATGPTPVPDDASFRRIETMFSPGARTKLETSGVFSLGPHLDLLTGHLSYDGGVTRDGDVTTALIGLTFTGLGSETDGTTPVISFEQSGQLTLQSTKTGWFVRAFDLKLTTKPPPPTPTPT